MQVNTTRSPPDRGGLPMDGRGGGRPANQKPLAPGGPDNGRMPPVVPRSHSLPPPPAPPSAAAAAVTHHRHLDQRGQSNMEHRGGSDGSGVGIERNSGRQPPPHHMERMGGPGGPISTGTGGPGMPAVAQRLMVGDPAVDRGGGGAGNHGPAMHEAAGFAPGQCPGGSGGMGFGPAGDVMVNPVPPHDGPVVRGTGGGTLGSLASASMGGASRGVYGNGAPPFGPGGRGDPGFGPPDIRSGGGGLGRGAFGGVVGPPGLVSSQQKHMGMGGGLVGGRSSGGQGHRGSGGDQGKSSRKSRKERRSRRDRANHGHATGEVRQEVDGQGGSTKEDVKKGSEGKREKAGSEASYRIGDRGGNDVESSLHNILENTKRVLGSFLVNFFFKV